MSAVLLDDHLTATAILGGVLPTAVAGAGLYTTGYWYYRLCHAYRSKTVTGSLSSRFPVAVLDGVVAAMLTLPEEIGIIGLRILAPIMADIVKDQRLNVLNLEGVAAAAHLGAAVHVAAVNDGPKLRAACRWLDIGYTAHQH